MTTPLERTRTLLQVGAFLRELRAGQLAGDAAAREADRLLRHYPTLSEIDLLAQFKDEAVGHELLTPHFDPEWFASYSLGPHQG